ncbi:hypothetical protein PoB_006229300 [Plakobranchus ocellatus]|uniref:Uncharacterized protein n=1 Tax=Plakobranchus ocellatus TaxID=259542 RepID=A0AAV4CV61_9GAST|nr:hypothetical protein PoB_006229300 [Plakobranchus ocellatus]
MSAFAASYAGSRGGTDVHDSVGTSNLISHHNHHHHHHHHHHHQHEPTAEEYEKLTWWQRLQYRCNCCLINWLVHLLCKDTHEDKTLTTVFINSNIQAVSKQNMLDLLAIALPTISTFK